MELHDPTELAAALIRRPSVTPKDEGAIEVLIDALESLGFACHDLTFQSEGEPPVRNLYARRGDDGPNLCFAGHTDVVPAGTGWTEAPFGAEIRDGRLFGRGAVDMKGAIAAFVSAVALAGEQPGSISLLITGDEEGEAIDGTLRLLEWLEARDETIDACVVGEPTNPQRLGDMIKVGRRGSLNATLTVYGVQGHVAYPNRAENPIPWMVESLSALQGQLDSGFPRFQPSNLEVTSVDVGNRTTNLIPGQVQAAFNIRFNPNWTGKRLEAELRKRLDTVGSRYALQCRVSGEAFLTEDVSWVATLAEQIEKHTGRKPELSTSGGTSDARFIRDACPVVEFGLVGQTMHKADEHVELETLRTLAAIYRDFIRAYFAST